MNVAFRARVARAALIVAVAVPITVVPGQQAMAVGGSCYANLEKQVRRLAPDAYRTRAYCTSLQRDSKARGILDRTGNDFETPWFTRLNTSYRTGYSDIGVNRARAEITRV